MRASGGASGRRLVGSVLVACALAVSLVWSATSASASELSDTGSASFADIAACAASSDHLLAAIVVDASGSLRQTDPGDARVGAIGTALDALGQLGASTAGTLDVEASLATFGTTYEELVGWGSVDADHGAALQAAVVRDLPARDRDNFTDYRAALRGAQQSLDNRATQLGGSTCKVVLWFTDGRLDVDGTGSAPATDAARAELCTPQGLVDGLRGDGIAVIALALFTNGGSASVTDQDRDRLRAVAEGVGEAETCGTVPVPAAATSGAYLRADDAAAMRRLFAQAAALIAGGTPGVSVVCPDAECEEGRLAIPTDPGVGRVRLVIEREPAAAPPQLISSDGGSVSLVPGVLDLGTASIEVTDRDGLMTAEIAFPGPGAPGGDLTLVADPSATTLVDVYYFWGAQLRLDAPDGLVVGQPSALRVIPVDQAGAPVDPAIFQSLDVEVTVGGAPVNGQWADGQWEVIVDVPTSDVAPSLHVEARATAVTAPNAIHLGPTSVQAEINTTFPPSFPTVSPARLSFPAVLGTEQTSAVLTFSGSDRGATRACVGAPELSRPEGAGEVSISADQECVDIPANGTAELVFTAQPESAADGRVEGVIPISLEGVDTAEPLSLAVPFGFSMSRPVDEGKRWALIALLTLVAVALAWATAEVARRVSDRFVLTTDTRSASVPVLVTGRGVERAGPAAAALLDPAADFAPVAVGGSGRHRQFETQGVSFDRTFPVFPLRSAQAWVADVNGKVVVTAFGDSLTSTDGRRAPTQLPGSAGFALVAERPSEDGTVRGRLVVVIDSRDGVASVLGDRLDAIHGAPWDRISDAVRAAYAHRDSAGARQGATTVAPAGAPGAGPALGVPARDADQADPPLRPPSTGGWWEDDASAAGPARPASSTWATSEVDGPALGASPRGPRKRRLFSRKSPPPHQSPGTEDPGAEPPHSTSNFWD